MGAEMNSVIEERNRKIYERKWENVPEQIRIIDPGFAGFTCSDCELADKCRYSFDVFNTDDDCLAEK